MAMEFKRRLPIPMEIREEMPLSAELTAKKQAFDAEVAKVFTGEDARKVLIIGPCSADREDSVLEYMNRLAKTAEEVKDKLVARMDEGGCGLYVCNWQGHDKNAVEANSPQVFEINDKGEVIWNLNDNERFGMISTISTIE